MTRETQKRDEEQTLRAVLKAIGLSADIEVQYGEAPDFIVEVDGRRIGVEITLFSSGVTTDGVPMRAIENEWEQLQQSAETARKNSEEFRNLNVGVMFHGKIPSRKDHPRFIAEVFDFARAHRADLNDGRKRYWRWDFHSPLLKEYLHNLHLRIDP
jgi:hypothetical protein